MVDPRTVQRCLKGGENPHYSCRFCRVPLHRGDSDCGCSEFRKVTSYASLCHECAGAVDVLMGPTSIGRVHRSLVHEANLAGRPTSD
jgi:hypothetical protein